MKEVSREEDLNSSYPMIAIVFHCQDRGREPMMHLELEEWTDEDDNYIGVGD